MNIRSSAEDYLETILMIQKRKNRVRSIDIATELDFAKPSVSVAMKNLEQGGYITRDIDGYISLTDSGYEIANKIYERHLIISEFLKSLGVDEKTALEDACKMEHCFSEQSFSALKKFIQDENR